MSETIDKDRDIRVRGELYTEIPEDLFIPPDALRIILEEFEGPLDLLLYLIKKQNIDIVDIPTLYHRAFYTHRQTYLLRDHS